MDQYINQPFKISLRDCRFSQRCSLKILWDIAPFLLINTGRRFDVFYTRYISDKQAYRRSLLDNVQALQPFETSINIYYYTQHNIPEHLHFQLYMRLSSGEVNLLHDNNILFSNALSVAYALWHGDFSLLQNSHTGSEVHPASY